MASNAAPMTYATLVARSMNELQLKTEAHASGWGLGKSERWNLDQAVGNLVFTTKTMIATAPAQIIGTYSGGKWLWGWDHPSVEPALQRDAQKMKEFGIRNKIANFTKQEVACTEKVAWEFTALACHLCGAQGAYRGPAGSAFVFMTFGKVSLSKKG